MPPLVSVVMSIYNDARYVAEAVRSVLAQTFTDFELIVVDDGAQDDGPEIVASFHDPRIRLIRQQNAGLAGALNAGISSARGKYIARQDADDVSEPDRLAAQVARLEADPRLVLIGTNATFVDEDGVEITEASVPETDPAIREVLDDPNVRNPFIHGSVVFRREAAEEVGLYRAELRYAQDYDLWLRLMDRGKLANLPAAKYRWRLRREGVGATKYEMQRAYAVAAYQSARCRRAGLPEGPILPLRVKQTPLRRLLRSGRNVPEKAAYDMALSKVLLSTGQRQRARARAFAVVRSRPVSLYAWLVIALSYVPTEFRTRIWKVLRRMYRRAVWS